MHLPNVKRFVRQQQRFIAIAVTIYAALWAVDRQPQIGSTLAYTLPLCNAIVLVRDYLSFLYKRRRSAESWTIYIALLLSVGILGVAVVNVIQFPLHKLPGQTLWQFLKSGWKLPFMATMIVGISMELYFRMRERLESKNRELQTNLDREAARREHQEKELEQAREIQQSLLPSEIPQIPGFEIDGAWEPAREVGGDYFDVLRLSDSKLGICIADVVGKSISAALLMANVQATVRAFSNDAVSPATLCTRVNSVLCSTISTGKFVTLLYGVLDARNNTFRYSNAGHLSPILIRAARKAEELPDGGAVLGVFPDWKYEDSEIELAPGDRLLLFTDGITEAGMEDGEEFGEERLIASVVENRAQSPKELKEQLLADAKNFCAAKLRDDATLIVIAATGQHEQPQKSWEYDVLPFGHEPKWDTPQQFRDPNH
jgi:sigma-B regulation protein RsbU (phosphoserine phosphatase)